MRHCAPISLLACRSSVLTLRFVSAARLALCALFPLTVSEQPKRRMSSTVPAPIAGALTRIGLKTPQSQIFALGVAAGAAVGALYFLTRRTASSANNGGNAVVSGRKHYRPLHWVLKVGDLEKSVDFYSSVLGLKVQRHEEFNKSEKFTQRSCVLSIELGALRDWGSEGRFLMFIHWLCPCVSICSQGL
jgi:hypothetical protein